MQVTLTHKKDLEPLMTKRDINQWSAGTRQKKMGRVLVKRWLRRAKFSGRFRIMQVGYTNRGNDPIWQIDWNN